MNFKSEFEIKTEETAMVTKSSGLEEALVAAGWHKPRSNSNPERGGYRRQQCLDTAEYIRYILSEALRVKPASIPIVSYVDNNDLYKSLHSTTLVSDKKLRIDIASIKQTMAEGNTLHHEHAVYTQSGYQPKTWCSERKGGRKGRWKKRLTPDQTKSMENNLATKVSKKQRK